MKTTKAENIDHYIASFDEHIRVILENIRATIHQAAPGAGETIKYDMPTFTWKGNLVHFAAFKHHIGFYPAPTNNKEFEKELSAYKTGKGSVQFPYDQPIPLDLVTRIVKLRLKQNEASAKK